MVMSGLPTASGGGHEPADAGERLGERLAPGPTGGQVQCPASGAASQSAGKGEQAAAQGAGDADGSAGEPEDRGPAQQVVREAGDDRPGAVGGELARREVREGLVFEVSDREFDDG